MDSRRYSVVRVEFIVQERNDTDVVHTMMQRKIPLVYLITITFAKNGGSFSALFSESRRTNSRSRVTQRTLVSFSNKIFEYDK
jgi:hypothetical protein